MRKFRFVLFAIFFIAFGLAISLRQPALAGGASLLLSPGNNSYDCGKNFSIDVKVVTGGAAINAGEATLTFNTDLLEVVGISKSGSIFSLWTKEPGYLNNLGTINFGGGIPASNYNGSSGKILTITFKAKLEGKALVNFSKARILAADGKGTNILSNMQGGVYILKAVKKDIPPVIPEKVSTKVPAAPRISSLTHPNPEQWYSNNNPEFFWTVPTDVTAVKLLVGKIPVAAPTVLYSPPVKRKRITTLDDGIWYFHVQFKNKRGWGGTTHRKILIDTNSPESFNINVDNEGDPANSTPILYFEAKDSLSGIEYYEVRILEEIKKVEARDFKTEPYRLDPLAVGEHFITVKAVDRAGNYVDALKKISIAELVEEIIEPVEVEPKKPIEVSVVDVGLPFFEMYGITITVIILLLIILLLILIIIYLKYKFSIEQDECKKKNNFSKKIGKVEKNIRISFRKLRKEVEKQIEYLDKKPGLTKKEKEIRDELQEFLNFSEENISKEIKEIGKEFE